MSQVLNETQFGQLEQQRLTKERQKIESYLSKYNGNRAKLREALNKDRIHLWKSIFDELNKIEDGAETVQWEEIIELKGFKIDRTRDPLGEGKYSQIYKAHWSDYAKEVAAKVLRAKEFCNAMEIKDFNKHVKVLLHLNHPKILKCIKCFMVSNTNKLYIFMQIANYGSVGDMVKNKKKPIPLASAKNWIRDALEALSFLHALGIGHRRVMPVNLLINSNHSCVKISLPEYFHQIADPDKHGKPTGGKCKAISDSGAYIPPEAVFNPTYDPILGDIWSVGCVLYYMLIMKPPFTNFASRSGFKEELETQRWQYCGIVDKSPKLDEDSKQFLTTLFQQEPEKRPNAAEILAHAYFK